MTLAHVAYRYDNDFFGHILSWFQQIIYAFKEYVSEPKFSVINKKGIRE
jgi:hypothetical protein